MFNRFFLITFGCVPSVAVGCGGTVVANNSYFVSPSYQGGETRLPAGPVCSLTINRAPGACQVRNENHQTEYSLSMQTK